MFLERPSAHPLPGGRSNMAAKFKLMHLYFQSPYLACALWLAACASDPATRPAPPAAPAVDTAVEATSVPADLSAAMAPPTPASRPGKTAQPHPTAPPVPKTPEAAPSSKPSPLAQAAPNAEKPANPEIQSPVPAIERASPVAAPKPPSHEAWDKLLQQYVNGTGKVNYAGLKKDRAKLGAYLKTLQENPPQADWPRADKMAFWINAYNAFTTSLIVDHYPIGSIQQLDGGKTWDVKRFKIGGRDYSLNQIENDELRAPFRDARIHFAVNCAAKSCPPLLNHAWTGINLEANLEKQAKAFVNHPGFNKLGKKELEISKIFEWYAADFGDLAGFLNRYAVARVEKGAKIKYREYDWGLNE